MTRPLALVTPDFPPPPGGIQTVSRELALALSGETEVVVLSASGEPCGGEARFERLRSASPGFRQAIEIRRALRRLRPRAVLALHWHVAPGVAYHARRSRTPWALVAHATEVSAERPGSLRHRVMGALFRRADAVVAPSPHTRALMEPLGVRSERIHLVPWGVDTRRFRPVAVPSSSGGRRALLTVTSLDRKRKNPELIFRLLRDELPECVYRIAGDGAHRPVLERLACELGVADRVEFLGRVPDERLPEVYSSADALVMPGDVQAYRRGDAEGFGLVFLEAAACGTPSIAFDMGGVAAAIADGRSGRLVPPGDEAGFAAAVREVVLDDERHARYRKDALAFALERPWSVVAREVAEVIETGGRA